MTCRDCRVVAAQADAQRAINRPKAKKERIAFAPMNDKIAAKLRSLKLVIAESLHVVDPVHTMRGPLIERLESVL
jgi:hypothetical protein